MKIELVHPQVACDWLITLEACTGCGGRHSSTRPPRFRDAALRARPISVTLTPPQPRTQSHENTHVEIARTCSDLVADQFEAKFHCAIWSQTGPRLVADLLARVSSLELATSELDDRPNSSSLQVCDQLRTCLRPDSVMEFGFNADARRNDTVVSVCSPARNEANSMEASVADINPAADGRNEAVCGRMQARPADRSVGLYVVL